MGTTTGDGTIDLEELGTVFMSLGQELNDRELQKVINQRSARSHGIPGNYEPKFHVCFASLQLMNEMDVDGGGSVEFDEFVVVMAKKLPRLRP